MNRAICYPEHPSRHRSSAAWSLALASTWLCAAAAQCLADGPASQPPAATAVTPGKPGTTAGSEFDAPVQPEARRGIDIVERLGETIPLDLTFVDRHGATVPIGRYFNDRGKPVVVLMIYFRCPLMCPQTINGLVKAVSGIDWTVGDKFNVVIVSFDPTETAADAEVEHDTVLANYGREVTDGVRDGFAVLTDTRGHARRLADALGFGYKFIPATGQYSHLAATFVLSPEGKVCRYLYGSKPEASTLRTALLEASEGRIGTSLDRFALWCMVFDESSGSYRLMATRVMKAGGVVSVVAVGGVLAVMFMVERRRRAAAVARSVVSLDLASDPSGSAADPRTSQGAQS